MGWKQSTELVLLPSEMRGRLRRRSSTPDLGGPANSAKNLPEIHIWTKGGTPIYDGAS